MNASFWGEQGCVIYCFPLKFIRTDRDQFFLEYSFRWGAFLHASPYPLQNPCTRRLMFIYDKGNAQLKDVSSCLGSKIPSFLWLWWPFDSVSLCLSRHSSLYTIGRWYWYCHSGICDQHLPCHPLVLFTRELIRPSDKTSWFYLTIFSGST